MKAVTPWFVVNQTKLSFAMKNEYWQQKWQSNDIGFNQEKPNKLLQRYLGLLNLKPGDRIFVPLCGKSVDMLWLASQGYDIVGIELSPIACEAFFHEYDIPVDVIKKDNVTLFQSEKIVLIAGDFFELNKSMLGQVDAVYDRAAVIALPARLRQRYARHLVKLLDKNAQMLLLTTSYNQSEMKGPPFSVDVHEVTMLYGADCTIKQTYCKPIKIIPTHLQMKGLLNACEHVYHLGRKPCSL